MTVLGGAGRGPAEGLGVWSWRAGRGSVIWQLMFPGEGLVAGLKRFPAERSASLFCLDAATGRQICDGFVLRGGGGFDAPVGDGWMIGLETTCRGLLFCHAFQEGSPEHQGIWAVDPIAGRLVWNRPEAVFSANLDTSLLVYRNRMFAGFPEREYWLIDPLSGEVIEALGTAHERANLLRMSAQSEDELQGIQLPDSSPTEEGPGETIRTGLFTIGGGHRPTGASGTWTSTLRVNRGGLTLYEGVMAAAAPAPLFNNFLVRGSMVYYIRENEELVGVALS
ncbi:MAG: hypothetical protein HGB29_04635 [Chlorobiaceae bacterium]|nr:hypothetical protein [Chlorobiaceae bacterium]